MRRSRKRVENYVKGFEILRFVLLNSGLVFALLFYIGCKVKKEKQEVVGPPIVSFISPQDGQRLSGKILIKLEVISQREIKKVELFIDGVTVASLQSPLYEHQGVPWSDDRAQPDDGTYVLKVQDFGEGIGSNRILVVERNNTSDGITEFSGGGASRMQVDFHPYVRVTGALEDQGFMEASTRAYDSDGGGLKAGNLSVDRKRVRALGFSGTQYTYEWDTTVTPDGVHVIKVWVEDVGGNAGQDKVFVYVENLTLSRACVTMQTFYHDGDRDGFGDFGRQLTSCVALEGFIRRGGDCNDTDPNINPVSPEICDGTDNNCNGVVDEGVKIVFYKDEDGDRFTDGITVVGCVAPVGYISNPLGNDCDDGNGEIKPTAPEGCDGIDNNCNGFVDEGVRKVFYRDQDGDGYTDGTTVVGCTAPAGYVLIAPGGDCSDTDRNRNPSVPEVCDGTDNNCNGVVDDIPLCGDFGSVPTAPYAHAPYPLSPTQIFVSWTDLSTNELGFRIKRGLNTNSLVVIASVGVGVETYVDAGLNHSTQYFYQICAFSLGGESCSSVVTATTLVPQPPPSPTLREVQVITANRINLLWSDNSVDEAGFYVERSLNNISYTRLAVLPANTTSWSDTGVQAGRRYYYRVIAYNQFGESTPSNVLSAMTPQDSPPYSPPSAPTSLTAYALSRSSVRLIWVDDSANEDGFKVARSYDGMNFSFVAVVSANQTDYIDTNLTPNTRYYYQVVAFNEIGDSSPSNITEVWTYDDTNPQAPDRFEADSFSSTEVYLRWQDNSDNETGFVLQRSLDNTEWQVVSFVGADITMYKDEGLQPGTRYYYRIAATNDSGMSSFSVTEVVTQRGQCQNFPVAGSFPILVDLTGDGKKEIITFKDKYIYIYSATGALVSLIEEYNYISSFAVGDVNVDGVADFIMGDNVGWISAYTLGQCANPLFFESGAEEFPLRWTMDSHWQRTSDDKISGNYSFKATGGTDWYSKYLTSNVIDITCASRVLVEFWAKWDLSDAEVWLEVWDGSGWTIPWLLSWSKSSWSRQVIDISNFVSGVTTAIRVGVWGEDSSSYFYVDDVKVFAGPQKLWEKHFVGCLKGNDILLELEDLDGDGWLEVIARVFDWNCNPVFYLLSAGGSVIFGPVVGDEIRGIGDVDGDGMKEIVLVRDGSVYAYKMDGSQVSGYPISVGAYDVALFDADGDGTEEVFASTSDRIEAYKGSSSWWHSYFGQGLTNLSFCDINSSGGVELFGGSSSRVYSIRTTTGVTLWSSSVGFGSPFIFADIDGNTRHNAIFRRGEYIYVFDDNGSNRLGWPKNVVGSSSFPLLVADIEGDDYVEILGIGGKCPFNESSCSAPVPAIYAMNITGQVLRGFPISSSYDIKALLVDDIDEDGRTEILSSTYGLVSCWKMDGFKEDKALWSLPYERANLGVHHLKNYSYQNRRSFDYEYNDAVTRALYIPDIHRPINAYIWRAGDVDWYKFTVTGGAQLRIELRSLPANYDIQLYDASVAINPNVAPLAQSTKAGRSDETIVYSVPTTGWYFVKVYGVDGAHSAADPYLLKVSIGGASPAPRFKDHVSDSSEDHISKDPYSYGCSSSGGLSLLMMCAVALMMLLIKERFIRRDITKPTRKRLL